MSKKIAVMLPDLGEEEGWGLVRKFRGSQIHRRLSLGPAPPPKSTEIGEGKGGEALRVSQSAVCVYLERQNPEDMSQNI